MRKVLLTIALVAYFLGGTHALAAVTNTHTNVSCANTSTEALAARSGRISALFVNDSTQVIWITVGGVTAVANEGIRLNANGGSYYMSSGNSNVDRSAVNCIVASGTGTILLTERHR